jgi:hypothetical protein
MKSHRQKYLLRMAFPCVQAVHHYMGLSSDPLSPKGDLVDTDEMIQYCIDNKLHDSANEIRFSQMTIAYVFNDYELADSHARMAENDNIWNRPHCYLLVKMSFMGAMVALAMAANGKNVRQNVKRAKKGLKAMKCFALSCPANCLDKKVLLEAELASVYRNEAKAFEKFTCAIALAKENGFLFNHALANERTARFFVARHKLSDAAHYFRQACLLYDEWGAKAKVERLRAEVDFLYDESKLEWSR